MENKSCKPGAKCKCSRSNEAGWDKIFEEIETSLHEDLPLRVRNWLKNKFSAPEIRNNNDIGDSIQAISKK